MMVKGTLVFLLLSLTAGSPPEKPMVKNEQAPRRPPDKRWKEMPPSRRKELREAYHHMKEHFSVRDDDNRLKDRTQFNRNRGFKRFPSHWRYFLVEKAHWARKQIEALPEEKKNEITNLPHHKKQDAFKTVLTPLFEKRNDRQKQLIREVFSPLERMWMQHLPPRKRMEALEHAGKTVFSLISHQSWLRFQATGEEKELIVEFLRAPRALIDTIEKNGSPTPPRRRFRPRKNEGAPDRDNGADEKHTTKNARPQLQFKAKIIRKTALHSLRNRDQHRPPVDRENENRGERKKGEEHQEKGAAKAAGS